jgi:hypothetical protein
MRDKAATGRARRRRGGGQFAERARNSSAAQFSLVGQPVANDEQHVAHGAHVGDQTRERQRGEERERVLLVQIAQLHRLLQLARLLGHGVGRHQLAVGQPAVAVGLKDAHVADAAIQREQPATWCGNSATTRRNRFRETLGELTHGANVPQQADRAPLSAAISNRDQ